MQDRPQNWSYVSGLVSALWDRFMEQRELLALLETDSPEERAAALRAGLLGDDLPPSGDWADRVEQAFAACVQRIADSSPEPTIADLILGARDWRAFRAYVKSVVLESQSTDETGAAETSRFEEAWRGRAENEAMRPFADAARKIQADCPDEDDRAGWIDAVLDAHEIAAQVKAAGNFRSAMLAEWVQTLAHLQAALMLIRARRRDEDVMERLSLLQEAGLDHPGLDEIAKGPETEWPSALDRLGLPGAEGALSGAEPAVLLARMIDDHVTNMTSAASGIPFGVERVFAFLWALKIEAINLRQALAGAAYGVPRERIAAELRTI